MKNFITLTLFSFVGSLVCMAQSEPFVGTWYAPDHKDGMLITLKEENGLFSGTFRGEGEVYQVQCHLKDGELDGQVLGKPLAVKIKQNGPYIELTFAKAKWGAIIDQSTARTYVLTLQGETSSAAANYVQSGPGGVEAVIFNGQVLDRKQLEEFNKRYHRYPRPGNYWYDPVSGLYGVVGYDAFGYLYPGHKFGPLQANASRGDSGYFINGRCLSKRELLIWTKLMGREVRPGNYRFDAKGDFGMEGVRNPMFNLFNLGSSYGTPEDMQANFWASQFSRGRRGANERDGYISVPGYGSELYGFGEP
ncbi:MAG: hypothetical protein KJT03_17245 [Verrucomicrobiae bacterium]|nr:hypothetical protein [Verrucomicrobiae bacterium]